MRVFRERDTTTTTSTISDIGDYTHWDIYERDTTTTTSTMSDIGDYTQPDISVGYYNNNINNVGFRRLHTFGYI